MCLCHREIVATRQGHLFAAVIAAHSICYYSAMYLAFMVDHQIGIISLNLTIAFLFLKCAFLIWKAEGIDG